MFLKNILRIIFIKKSYELVIEQNTCLYVFT